MPVNIGMNLSTGKVSFSVGPVDTRKENLNKWLGRNSDAILVKLIDQPEHSAPCSVGHLCRIEESDDGSAYFAFVGKHLIGRLPNEAIEFANSVDLSPEFLVSIIGKIEDGDVYIYIAE